MDIEVINPTQITMTRRDMDATVLFEQARQRKMRIDNAFECADNYKARFWALANALHQIDVHRDWRFYLNAEQDGKCESLFEWVCAQQKRLGISPSWAMFMAGLPQLRQEIIYQLPERDVPSQEEAWQIINETDPSRLQAAQSLLHKQLKVAQQTSGAQRREAVEAIQTTLRVARDARTRNDVIEHVKQVGSGVVERTVHFRVGDLVQADRGLLDISDLPQDAFVASKIWYNPAKQAEYKAEAHELEKRRQTHRRARREAYLFWQARRERNENAAVQRLVQGARDAIAQSAASENQA